MGAFRLLLPSPRVFHHRGGVFISFRVAAFTFSLSEVDVRPRKFWRMLLVLARVAREARLARGLRQLDIATAAGVSHETISRLERGQSWPKDPDRIIAAYELECGLSGGELWKRASALLG